MNLLTREVVREGRKIELQPIEFSLLEYLLRNAGRVVSKTMIMEHVWDYNFDPQTNVVEARISRLRDKIDRDFSKKLIHTIRGVESQFFLLSDIGEAALVLPAEPSFYWVSTNNGDDNQLFSALLEECEGDFVAALKQACELAPNGAKDLMQRRRQYEEMQTQMSKYSLGGARSTAMQQAKGRISLEKDDKSAAA